VKIGKFRHRAILFLALVALIVIFGLMVSNLLRQLEDLSSADRDNTQWSISQLDAEFSNLNATLSEQLSADVPDSDQVRLRLDITLSRLGLISTGNAKALFADDDAAAELIAATDRFTELSVAVSEQAGPLAADDIRTLKDLTTEVRPAVRRLVLMGVSKGAEHSKARRAAFARNLVWTGGTAIGLLLVMAALLLVLDALMRRAQQRDTELHTSSKQLASTVEASLDAIVTSDDSGKIIEFNAAAEEIFGWTRTEIIGRKMEDTFIPHRMREAHNKGMKRYLETKEPRVVDGGRVELAALRKSGEEFPVELNITSVVEVDTTKFIAYLRDISERKINEQNLIDAKERAERLDTAKSQFLTVMSHEMRTPLNGVLGVLDLLMQTKLSAKQERYAKIAMASSEILLEHTNEALDITRIETGTLQFTNQDFDLQQLVSSLIDVLSPLATEKGLTLSHEIDQTLGVGFNGDSNRLRQILTNLVGNAIKFTETGSVALRVRGIHGPDKSSLSFAVTDTGPGIAAEYQEQVFEDFVALAHSEGRQRRGDGLGLSISRKIARQMGGDISVESELGTGSTFLLTVPLERSKLPEPENIKPRKKTKRAQTKRHVLVVEDNDINRSVLRDMLEGIGHTVAEAENGAVGLEKAAKHRFDVIFMDISMPIMDGIEATQKLRAGRDGLNSDSTIYGLTAHGRDEYRDQALAAGMNRLYTKPIRIDALRAILDGLSAETPEPDDADLQSSVLTDMLQTLGAEKTQQTGDKFFAELEGLLEQMRREETSDLAEASHKMKGAAALLGFDQIEAPLESLEKSLRAGEDVDLVGRAEFLAALSKRAKSGFQAAVSKHRD